MTVLLNRTKKGRSGKEFYPAQHISGRSYMHHRLFSYFQMFSFFGTESTAVSLVSLSHFEKPNSTGTKKEREVKNPVKTWLRGNTSSLI